MFTALNIGVRTSNRRVRFERRSQRANTVTSTAISDTTKLSSAKKVSISHCRLSIKAFCSRASRHRNTSEPLWWSEGVHGRCAKCAEYRFANKRPSRTTWSNVRASEHVLNTSVSKTTTLPSAESMRISYCRLSTIMFCSRSSRNRNSCCRNTSEHLWWSDSVQES